MKTITKLIIVIGLLSPFQVLKAKDTHSPTKLTASYFSHPAMPPFKALLVKSYADIGIKLEPLSMPSSRGIMELNDGLVDVDIVRSKEFVTNSPNIIAIEPPLYTGELVLLCNKGKACSKEVLSISSTTILTTLAVKPFVHSPAVKANLLNSEDLFQILKMLRAKKVDYVIYGTTAQLKAKLKEEFSVVPLKTVILHHVINKKHADLIPALEASISANLQSFDPDSVSFN